MKEINIGRVLIKNRHKRGITQDELATHLGVSKGAVSKWETGVSHS
ncbi:MULTISPECIES: helix-turn-helix domain-containing protein [Clostridia]|jgi:transcriptional regulator with XRE-family HTH domain|nr:helix-turn-helix transcriptional regulator [Clostridium fessum]